MLFQNLSNKIAAVAPSENGAVDHEGGKKEKKQRDPDESSALSDYELSHEEEQPNRAVQRERLKEILRKIYDFVHPLLKISSKLQYS